MNPATEIPSLTTELAERFASIALGHVRREYPHALIHVVEGPLTATRPRDLHPIFYGSFDWHSCVHGYWLLAHVLRRHPELDIAAAIVELFDEQLTPEKVAAERDYFDQPFRRSFERPYGWAWLLKLAAEVQSLGEQRWSRALAPLAERLARGFADYLPLATYPSRVGTHGNTAFALRLAADYAQTRQDDELMTLLTATAKRWYADDDASAAWGEPSGNDFLSPTLIEAECMRRLLPREEFGPWFERFLPDLARQQPSALFTPATVSDRSDGQIAHLDGLNLSRAWCLRALAEAAWEPAAREALRTAAARHLHSAIEHVAGEYMGEHWLASFAALALDETA